MRQLASLFILLGIILSLNAPLPLAAADEAAFKALPPSVLAAISDKAASYNDRGISLFYQGEYGDALLEFNKALAEDPVSAIVLINRGVTFEKRGQHAEAIENFYSALDFNKNDLVALKHLATAYFLNGEADKAIGVYTEIVSIEPSDFMVYTKRGAAYASLKHHDVAIEDFSRTIYLNPNFNQAFINRGISFTELGKSEWAVSDFDKALSTSPKDPFIYLLRSIAYSKSGNYKNALADLNRSCSLGYSAVCSAVKRAGFEKKHVETSFTLNYATQTTDEVLYTAALKQLDLFVSAEKRSEMHKLIRRDLRPLPMETWRPLMTDTNKASWIVKPSAISFSAQGTVAVLARFQPEEGSPLYLRMQNILKEAGKAYERYRFSEDTFEINCKDGRIRAISNREYDLGGVVINTENYAGNWFNIERGSPADAMRQSFCQLP